MSQIDELNSTVSVRPTRVAYVTQWFPPEPAGISGWIAGAMKRQGLAVRVVTAEPNYPSGVIYDGYSAWKAKRERIAGVEVTRSPIYPSHSSSAIGRVLNYLSFAFGATVVGHRVLATADVILVYSSPATAAVPAMLSRMRHRPPYVLLIEDLWPDSVLETGMIADGPRRRLAESSLAMFDHISTSRAARIIVISPGMKRALVQRGVDESKISVVYNWVDETVLKRRPSSGNLRRSLGIGEQDFVVMYAGNHGKAQGLSAWIDAMARLRDLKDLHFVLVGDGTEKSQLMSRASALGLTRVHFSEPVASADFPEVAADADVQAISLTRAPLFKITIPGKVQSCLALGCAIVAAIEGDAAELLMQSGAALMARPEDAESIENAIRRAYAEGKPRMRLRGDSGSRFYTSEMSSSVGSAKISRELQQALAKVG